MISNFISRNATESDTSEEEFDVDPPLDLKIPKEWHSELESYLEGWRRDPQNVITDLEEHEPFKCMVLDIESSVTSGNDTTNICKPLIRIFGLTENGASVCLQVHNFTPHFFVSTSISFESDVQLRHFEDILRRTVHREILRDISEGGRAYHSIDPVIQVERVLEKEEVNVYDILEPSLIPRPDSNHFFKISCAFPKYIWIAAQVLNEGRISYPPGENSQCIYDVYEAHFCNSIRFAITKNLKGCSWIQINPGKYTVLPEQSCDKGFTHCQIEIKVESPDDIKIMPEIDKVPPLRVLSFDIEAMVRPPNYQLNYGQDRVLQISSIICDYPSDEPFARVVFALGSCDPIPTGQIIWFQDEVSLFKAWRHFLISCDPDILTGHNIINFDLPLLIKRAQVLGIEDFPFLGRVLTHPTTIKKFGDSPKRTAHYFTSEVKVHGRIIMDTFQLYRRHSIVSNGLSLEALSRRLLGDGKEDVPYKSIFKMQNLSSASRASLASYCLKDSDLVLKLLRKNVPGRHLDFISYYLQKSRRCGTPLRHLVHKSDDYNHWVMQIWKQKNPDVNLGPVTPLKKSDQGPPGAPKKSHRGLFPNDEEEDDLGDPKLYFDKNRLI